jgi:hypothetical protein
VAEDNRDKVATLESVVEVFRRASLNDELIDIKDLPPGTEFDLITA